MGISIQTSQDFISIVICCVDMMEATKKCLESIWANTPPPYEIIVVAQACKPETAEWLRGLQQNNKIEVCLSPQPLGAATASNEGYRRAKADYIFGMSNSSVVKKGWLYPLLDTLKNHPEYGWVAAKHIRPGVVMKFSAGALFSKKALFEVGLFDEEYSQGIGFEDDDLLRKFWEAGYRPHSVDESATYREPPGGSTYKMIYGDKMPEMFRRNQELFRKKWGETGTDWDAQSVMPTIDPNDVIQNMHRIGWIISRVKPEDTILEVGVAENPVWAGTPFKVTTLDRDKGCKPDVVAEAESLPFEPQSFDIVAVGELLEHVPEPQIVLREAARVARKKVVVTVPDEYSWPDECKPFWNPSHVRFYTYSTFQDELKKLGLPFKVWNIKFRGWSHWCAEIYCDNKPEKPQRLDASYYNEDYFKPGPKSTYDKPFIWEVEGEEYRKTARSLKDTFRPKNALDIGCAKGFLCKALLEAGIDAYGCDISEFAVNNCEPEVKGRLKIADIRDGLPYPDSSFDLVCSFSTLEHIEMEFLPYVASEMARVTRKWAFINVPVSLSRENKPWGDPSHRTYMPASYWISLFCEQGLTCDWGNYHHSVPPYSLVQAVFLKGELIPSSLNKGGKSMTEQGKKLNIGSFTVMLPPPWLNLDILDLAPYAKEKGFNFQQVDVSKGLPYEDNSADFINSSHLIEHLTVEEGIAFLKEAHRVLRSEGTIRIGTPDINKLVDAYKAGEMDKFDEIQPEEYKHVPSQADKFWRILTAGHKTCYDLPAIKHSLEAAGFKKVDESEYNQELDMFPEVSLYLEAKKESALPEHPEVKVPTSQPPADIPEYWRQFAAGNRMKES